jgi:hypothetical protein
MHGSASVAGIGESTYFKRGESPHTEFQLACIAIQRAVADAGLELADIDGFVSYLDQRNTPVRLARALGLKELRWTGIPWAGGGNSMAAAVQITDAAVSSGHARHVVVFRALAQARFGRFGQAGGSAGGVGSHLGGPPPGTEPTDPHSRAPVRAAHGAVHATTASRRRRSANRAPATPTRSAMRALRLRTTAHARAYHASR